MKRRPSTLARDLTHLEATNPAVALAAENLDRITRQITGLPGGPLPRRLDYREQNRADVAAAAEAKRRREAEAERWIAEVRARKVKRT